MGRSLSLRTLFEDGTYDGETLAGAVCFLLDAQ